eukprot:CAMPEP_0174902436 /NCGR_PEP_ID=MMETSP0167-20121228/37835_1 /TAXON_ID=38298 /ORGANISM="Rhodella maculata, Strain CCMP736" /LENGTH=368 /DNA_ID=CAMNT_0016144441 /DNA_START=270 /DNA_END=1376 /DNA_ORIENTATION=+
MAWNTQRELIIDEAYDLVASSLKEEFGQLLLNKSRAACFCDEDDHKWLAEPAKTRNQRESALNPQETSHLQSQRVCAPKRSTVPRQGDTALASLGNVVEVVIEPTCGTPASEHSAEATTSVEPPSREKIISSVGHVQESAHVRLQEGLKSLPPRRIRFRSESPPSSANSVPPIFSRVVKTRYGFFLCPKKGCSKKLTSEQGIRYHFELVHGERTPKTAPKIVPLITPRPVSDKVVVPPFPGAVKRGAALFACPLEGCLKTLTTNAGIGFHYESIHRGNSQPVASKRESPPVSVNAAAKEFQGAIKNRAGHFQCPWTGCGKTLTSSQGIHLHYEAIHQGKEYRCPKSKCQKNFKYKTDLAKHKNLVHKH